MCCLGVVFFCVTLLKVAGTWGLRNVSLLISPSVVVRGKPLELLCRYDLQDAPLYSIKFYRGTHEFYRFCPSDVPPVKLFPFTGLRVDLPRSQDNKVVVEAAEFSLAGNISCEVSTDAPHFSTQIATNSITVVELPKTEPQIEIDDTTRVEAGSRLRATCSSAPARPAPSLTWFINDEPAVTLGSRSLKEGVLERYSVTLDVPILPRHLEGGQLVLKCTALVADIYKETVSLPLVADSGGPKHERVRASSSTRSSAARLGLLLTAAATLLPLTL